MDELEFCVKSLSYPLGMILERLERKNGEKVRVGPGSIELPDVPFPALCYLTAVALFDSLDLVDRKRLSGAETDDVLPYEPGGELRLMRPKSVVRVDLNGRFFAREPS